MALFCAAIRKDLVSLLKFPFRSYVQVFLGAILLVSICYHGNISISCIIPCVSPFLPNHACSFMLVFFCNYLCDYLFHYNYHIA